MSFFPPDAITQSAKVTVTAGTPVKIIDGDVTILHGHVHIVGASPTGTLSLSCGSVSNALIVVDKTVLSLDYPMNEECSASNDVYVISSSGSGDLWYNVTYVPYYTSLSSTTTAPNQTIPDSFRYGDSLFVGSVIVFILSFILWGYLTSPFKKP